MDSGTTPATIAASTWGQRNWDELLSKGARLWISGSCISGTSPKIVTCKRWSAAPPA
jgi:hypothetical protein